MQDNAPTRFHAPQPAPILVSYRQDGNGKGAFFDHYTLQRHTHHNTKIVKHHELSRAQINHYIQNQTHSLRQGLLGVVPGKLTPAQSEGLSEGGLLVIPGVTRADHDNPNAQHKMRMSFESAVIRDAMNRGRPILGLCGGSWKLWEWGQGDFVPVRDHAYARMPNIGVHGNVGYNIQVHGLRVEDNSLLRDAMGGLVNNQALTLNVNSVHWKACNHQNTPSCFKVTGTAVNAPNITLTNRVGNQMVPEVRTVEAFETKHGVPVLGIQWHPEAYPFGVNEHNNLLNYMAKAGDAFAAKQTMLNQFKQTRAEQIVEDDELCVNFSQLSMK